MGRGEIKMRYLGGKFRQSPQIVAAVEKLHPDFKTYVEPFCGALWSATAMMRRFPDRKFVLNDINPYLVCTWKCGKDGWNPPPRPTEKDYRWYKKHKPVDDPMTGYLGFAWAFAGKFFGTPARTNGKFTGSYSTTLAKIQVLRQCDVTFSCQQYTRLKIPARAMVYLDPPYEGRTHQSNMSKGFDYLAYHTYASKLAAKATVIATEFHNNRRWKLLHSYGDTVIRHHSGGGSDGTCELLMQVRP